MHPTPNEQRVGNFLHCHETGHTLGVTHIGDDHERAAAHETVAGMTDLETRRALAWLAENHPAALQDAVRAVRETFAAVTGDRHGNLVRQEGVDRCPCGCKYWERDRCVDCGGRQVAT